MKVQIKNLGAVKNATIDLSKKLNVFCGGNSTGKTYMAYILYAITSLDNKSFGLGIDNKYIDTLIEKNEVNIPLDIQKMFTFKTEENKKIKPNLWKLFSIPESKSNDFFSKTEIIFLESETEFTKRIKEIRLNEIMKFHDFSLNIEKDEDNSIKIRIPIDTIKNENFMRYFDIAFLSILYSKLVFYPVMSSTIFPVERNSIFTFNKELSIKNNEKYDLIKQLSSNKDFNPFDLLFNSSNRYPQPIRDCLKVADDLDTIKKANSIFYDFALEIETELLDGKVIIGKEGNVQFLSNKTSKNKTLSFHQSSSIVKTLAGLIIYLKHTAQKNDLVIIDEPELNLHPDNQIKLTRILARLINKGLNLVVSTHSDYILREINNLIMLSSSNDAIKSIKEKNEFKEDEFINKNNIDVHYFHYKFKTQASVDLIPVSEFGFNIPSIDIEIEKQNDLNNDLYYGLKYNSTD
ncbi:AAA family ATPase [Tenacibaculum finnmarkense]|uniref:AAA family ATPase n=1 Tax=Tenacibaculum finnmarkense TaxID=2781243 RepID=UPI00187B4E66|nr:AAA family ATPase [Tenacibaculum finnmarkense]MBE7660182.1 AAA family ATPase [Tenacibaculum finnmarkense genomovar finnmarkense]MCG8232964.1 AAA family ATPase [Tenacibaculum finnmarkense genomovar finnmarkense]MCG8251909.1 AAA family ATPase [Tenacibaculum finnmarkense genomovar finnmarkense]MCG8815438.1 ATP-binding protein [Tenacibaculum finnmarkense]MCG8820462.1 ATP-binding protein [Tenacibaculum finnmarkense]